MSQKENIMLSPEEIEELSRILAEALSQQMVENPEIIEALFIARNIIRENEITCVIDLDSIASATFGITDPLGQLQEWFVNVLNSIANWIVSGIEAFINDYVLPAFDTVTSSVTSFIDRYVLPAFDSLYNSIYSGLTSFIDKYVLPAFDSLYASISSYIDKYVIPAFDEVIASISTVVESLVYSAVSSISSYIGSAVKTITSNLSSIYDGIVGAVSSAVDAITATLSSIIEGVYNAVLDVFTALSSIGNTIIDVISTSVSSISQFLSGISSMIINGFMSVGVSITQLFSFMMNMARMIEAGFKAISQTFMGFVNAIIRLPDLLAGAFRQMGEWIWGATPDWFRTALEGMGKFLTEDLVNAVGIIALSIQSFASDPSGWLQANLIQPAFSMINLIGGKILELFNLIIDKLKDMWKGVEEIFSGFIMFIGQSIFSFMVALYDKVGGFGEVVKPLFEKAYEPIPKDTGVKISNLLKPIFKKVFKDIGIGSPEYLKLDFVTSQIIGQFSVATALAFSPFWAQIPIRLISFILHGIGQFFYGLDMPIRINLRPLGIGVDKTFNLGRAIGASLSHFAKELKQWVDEVGRGIVYGFSIWASQPIAKSLNYMVRNIIPVELPQLNVIQEFTRRALPHSDFEDIRKLAWYYMALYGYSDYVIDLYLKSAEDYYIEVEDRFGVKRRIPLALIYSLPSSSDVARMMVRDIIINIEDFTKFFLATGMYPDIAKLYYLLHFRYPPPERLWQFTMRGISGLLWATITDEEKEAIKRDVEASGGFYPKSPVELNFKAGVLFNAFKSYMKWHDFARFAYMENFTSDNLIYIDTLADIPSKIDQRWMVKWGLYEHLKNKGVTYQSPIQEFVKKLIDNRAVSEIQMDLTNFSRTLQATGIHPYWVPVTAVAEAMNALTEERTYLRTGIINLFKEGFISKNTLKNVLAGAFVASFKVAYFDLNDYTWKTGYVNLPVMYLPAERELLALRADMDRVLDILREIQRDISQAYQEAIITNYEEYKERLSSVIESLRGLTPVNVKVEFIEDYYKPYVKALEIYREVYTVRRIRSWAMRWLGWIMYRVATGLVTEQELSKLVNTLVEYARLTEKELAFFADVLETMRGIAVKEYIPTPTQIATISEYIAVPDKLIEECFEARMIPEEWRPIWAKYIKVKPIADDIKKLLTTYRRALLYATIPDEIKKQVEMLAKLIGFTEKEMSIMQLRVTLEELIQSSREYIPTPYLLATLVEYVPKAREFFGEVMRAKRVPERWQKIWAEYIDVRPLVNDVKTYLSRAEKLYVRFMISKEVFQKILDEVSNLLGYTAKEIEFLMKVTELERARSAWTELIGTVERLVSLSEYSPSASKYALGKLYAMIDSLPITNEEKQQLKQMWEEYIRNRPVKSEARMYITQLINLFVDGLISEADFKRELNEMKKWGFSDNEIMFYEAIAGLRKARKLRIPIGYPAEEQAG